MSNWTSNSLLPTLATVQGCDSCPSWIGDYVRLNRILNTQTVKWISGHLATFIVPHVAEIKFLIKLFILWSVHSKASIADSKPPPSNFGKCTGCNPPSHWGMEHFKQKDEHMQNPAHTDLILDNCSWSGIRNTSMVCQMRWLQCGFPFLGP